MVSRTAAVAVVLALFAAFLTLQVVRSMGWTSYETYILENDLDSLQSELHSLQAEVHTLQSELEDLRSRVGGN